jgi:ferric-dicitrate binding protein FerR (iron transport regulator)
MPVTLTPVSPGILAQFRTGDEAAIERVYREYYRQLLDAATRELGDGARAARVVERVAADLWKDRAQMSSQEAFDTLLVTRLQHRIGVEKGRMASLHRHPAANALASHGPAPSADVSWEHVRTLLHPVSDEELKAMRHESRHVAAAHFAAVGRRRKSVWSIVLGAIAVAGILSLVFFVGGDGQDKALNSPEARTISAKAGQRGTFTLGDGTVASLGSVSAVRIPPGFPNQARTIALEGTASFQVPARKGLPFSVRTERATLIASGTTFDVSAFADGLLLVQVREGGVEVKTPKASRTLRAGEAAAVEASGLVRTASAQEVTELLGWIGGTIEIVDRPLREALPVIRRWYDIDMRPADERLLDRRITMRVGLDSARAAITQVEKLAGVKLVYERNAAVLRDAR